MQVLLLGNSLLEGDMNPPVCRAVLGLHPDFVREIAAKTDSLSMDSKEDPHA